MRAILILIGLALGLGACSHTPPLTPQGEQCGIVRYSLESPLPDEPALESILGEDMGDVLILSGGSQNGAFGAGFLEGWHSTGEMPEFQLVTGISTGALQATGAFIGRPELTVQGYTIDSESDLLDAFVDGSEVSDGLTLGAAITALRVGAISDLVPLRRRLDGLLKPDVLKAVAARYEPDGSGAFLLAGATDVDLGQAVAFDLTELAHRYSMADPGSDERRRLKDCYIEALVASSIVPPAAQPVFIDNRMYIDGGVRNAVFDDRIGQMLPDTADIAAFEDAPDAADVDDTGAPEERLPGFYIVLNGTGESRAVCGKVDPADCVPISSTVGQLQDWDLVSLAFRTLDLLVSQVERLSIERAAERARDTSAQSFFARIRVEDVEDPNLRFSLDGFEGEKTCADWFDEDVLAEMPLEFHRRYMRCLIRYGRMRGAQMDWDFAPVE